VAPKLFASLMGVKSYAQKSIVEVNILSDCFVDELNCWCEMCIVVSGYSASLVLPMSFVTHCFCFLQLCVRSRYVCHISRVLIETSAFYKLPSFYTDLMLDVYMESSLFEVNIAW